MTEQAPTQWLPVTGQKASMRTRDGIYMDVTVDLIMRGGRARVTNENSVSYEIATNLLEKPLSADINERFSYFKSLATLVMEKKLRSLFVTGEGGIGKSFTVQEILEFEELQEETDYVMVKGYTTARAMYNTLRDNAEKIIIFDDCDPALTNPEGKGILKASLDTYDKRVVSWLTAKGGSERFQFNGSVIFLSNKNRESVDQAILSRSIVVDLYMTEDEKIERMGFILEGLNCVSQLTPEERWEVLNMIDKYKYTIQELNLRTLIKGLIVYEQTKDLEVVKYQILNG